MMQLFEVQCDGEVEYLVAAERAEDCKSLVLRDEGVVDADGPKVWSVTPVDASKPYDRAIRTDDGRGLVSVGDLFNEATAPGVLGCSEWS
jgi:hypothetical protein